MPAEQPQEVLYDDYDQQAYDQQAYEQQAYEQQAYDTEEPSMMDLATHFQNVRSRCHLGRSRLSDKLDRWILMPRHTIRMAWIMIRLHSTHSTPRAGLSDSLYVQTSIFYDLQSRLSLLQLNYHLYTQARPEALQTRYFVSDDIREELQKRSEAMVTGPPPGLSLPDELQGYHSLVPLEPVVGERRKFGNWYSSTYKAVNTSDGFTYVLKRVESALPFACLS